MRILCRLVTCLAVCLTLATSALAADDIVVADFEVETYSNWKVEGSAFGTGPARGSLRGQMPV